MEQVKKALVIVDAQRGFMPAYEGERLGLPGFGELGVDGGEAIVAPINALTRYFQAQDQLIATTQDWHPAHTAHFSDEPNFVNTWPAHCVAGTPGAELAPDLLVAQDDTIAYTFRKGKEAIDDPADDTSYTGALADEVTTAQLLPDFLRQQGVEEVVAVGLALGDGDENKLCLDSTAVDLNAAGFNVTVATDAVEAVLPENRQKSLDAMAALGIRLATTEEILNAA
ncbi:isochorismatase family protein [Candidatus Saccharibacteria bacterium]|nr:isochorismatase family protein [Candidatus Saccharibacteria bacterium]